MQLLRWFIGFFACHLGFHKYKIYIFVAKDRWASFTPTRYTHKKCKRCSFGITLDEFQRVKRIGKNRIR